MAFERQLIVTRQPHIREIQIVVFRTIDPDDPEGPQSVRFRIAIDDQFNHPMNHLHGDLIPHAPPTVRQALIDLMDWAWNKANTEVIG